MSGLARNPALCKHPIVVQNEQSQLATESILPISTRTASVFSNPTAEGLAAIVASTTINAFLHGGTYSEREQLAWAIHGLSNRRHAAYVNVDCHRLEPRLFGKELFGVSSPVRKGFWISEKGCFEQAYKGTLFLNNIERLAPSTQRRLLRVLQDREISEESGRPSRKIDIRLIVGCGNAISASVKQGDFDEELYNLLRVFPIGLSENLGG